MGGKNVDEKWLPRHHAVLLSEAIAEARARRKEPFDLRTVEALCGRPLQASGLDVEQRSAVWEFEYYVVNRDVVTLEEFARLLARRTTEQDD